MTVITQLYNSYLRLRNYEQAQHWMRKYAKLNTQSEEFYLKYAEQLASVEKYQESQSYYQKYLSIHPEDRRAINQSKAFDQLHEFKKESLQWNIFYLSINTPFDELSPIYFERGIVYTANSKVRMGRRNISTWNNKPFYKIYEVVDTADLKFINIKNLQSYLNSEESRKQQINALKTLNYGNFIGNNVLNKNLTTNWHDGPITFNGGQNMIFLNRNKINTQGNKQNHLLDLYWGKYTGGQWHDISPFEHNVPNYSSAHPALDLEGKTLYFVSDKPGGYGGKDIYYSIYQGNGWSKPINMGPEINTEGDEMFPTMSKYGTFHFSSNGHAGLGGLDIFSVELYNNKPKSKVTNLGYPINSSKDDFGLAINETNKTGYFTSNRFGSDDILRFEKIPTARQNN